MTMRIRMNCPQCGAARSAPAEWFGRKVQCNDCGNVFTLLQQPTATPHAAPPIPDANSPLKQDSTGEKTTSKGIPMKSDPLKVEDLVDMTAMVDIVFFLLIFFIVTAVQQIISSVDMGQPVAPAATDRPGRVVEIAEEKGKKVTVHITADDLIWVDDDQIPNEQDLKVRLREEQSNGAQQMQIIGHDEAHSFSLVMVLDSGYETGFQDIQLSVLTQDDWDAQGF
jgi:biopolymer transport protein ExbD